MKDISTDVCGVKGTFKLASNGVSYLLHARNRMQRSLHDFLVEQNFRPQRDQRDMEMLAIADLDNSPLTSLQVTRAGVPDIASSSPHSVRCGEFNSIGQNSRI
jgi:hypothetical protein